MEMMLNLINKIPDSEAEYLYKSCKDQSGEEYADENKFDSAGVSDIQKAEQVDVPKILPQHRRLVLFVSHSRDLIAFGFSDESLVWFSFTKTDDLFLTRRIFDCMKVGSFYRKAVPEKALELTGITKLDLYGMCRIDVTDIETDYPVFKGCFTNNSDSNAFITGVEFANQIAVLPQRLQANIANIGPVDDILAELEKDYQVLETLYEKDEPISKQKQNVALSIRNKWRSSICLNMSDRAAVRSLYRDICCHKYAVYLPSVSEMLKIKDKEI